MNNIMTTFPTAVRRVVLLLALVLPVSLAACGGGDADEEARDLVEQEEAASETAEGAVTARMENGVQVVDIEAGPMGYAPNSVVLEAGVPARLVFTRTVDSECSSQIQVPAFDVPVTDLPINEAVAVEFTPDESGEFTFVCGMNMQRGTLMVRS